MLRTTIGQLMVNETLPEDLRDYNRELDKKGISALLQEVAETHPEKYREIAKELSDVGRDVAYSSGGNSFGLQHMRKSLAAQKAYVGLRRKIEAIHGNPNLSRERKDAQILKSVLDVQEPLTNEVYRESAAENNPLAKQVSSGSRGNRMNLRALRAGEGIYEDGKGRMIPIPVLSSYSEGLNPVEYWAGTYGARKGITDLKLATADAGYMAKQMNRATHRLLVSETPTIRTTKARFFLCLRVGIRGTQSLRQRFCGILRSRGISAFWYEVQLLEARRMAGFMRGMLAYESAVGFLPLVIMWGWARHKLFQSRSRRRKFHLSTPEALLVVQKVLADSN